MATILDVAKQAGVSTATVSRSFGATHLLHHATRERVLEAAKQLNYSPRSSSGRISNVSPQARGAVSTAIGFQFFGCTPSDTLATNAFYGPVLAGAQAEADALGMHMLLHTTYRHKVTKELPQMIREQAVAGMLLVGTADPWILHAFMQYVPHIVLVDNRDTTSRHDCILSDGYGGAFLATDHLLKLGHKKIVFLTSGDAEVTFDDRLNGFLAAHFRAGIPVGKESVFAVNAVEDASNIFISVPEVVSLLKRPEPPTAIVAANDAHALAVIHACRQLGLSVPRDISVIGFDDADFAAHAFPPLTTVRVNKELLGRLAVRRLSVRLHSSEPWLSQEPPILMELPVSLLERLSCAPPRAG